jgi:hypothetical protein
VKKMRSNVSARWKLRSVMAIAAVLAGAAMILMPIAAGCGPNDIIIHDCIDGSAPDSGDGGNGGNGGSGGSKLPYCN